MLKQLAIIVVIITSLLSAHTASAEEVTISTFRGEKTVTANPQTTVVLDLHALDTLQALGVKVDATLDNVYLDYLTGAAQGVERVGSLFQPDFEAIHALAPDLVIAGGRSYESVPDLEKIAPTIDMTIWGDTVAQGLQRLDALAEIYDKKSRAEQLRADFDSKMEKARLLAANQGRTLIVMTNGPKISAYGASGRFGWLHKNVGLVEAVNDVERTTHGEAISFEFIRDANPDTLLVIDRASAIGRGAVSAKSTLDNAMVREINAWKNGRVIYLSAGPIYIANGGIQSMNQTLDELLAGFASQ
ncbi:MAG: ABC transporter substrate-binding protein [Pseudomonadota bacterium]